jgi:hypothetical protein
MTTPAASGPPTSPAASWPRPTWPPGGATPTATAPGPGPGPGPAARLSHHRAVHVEARRHRRVPHGRPRQLTHHARHVRRHHRRRPQPRTHSHTVTAALERAAATPSSGKLAACHGDACAPGILIAGTAARLARYSSAGGSHRLRTCSQSASSGDWAGAMYRAPGKVCAGGV